MSIKISLSPWRSSIGFAVGLIVILSLAEVPIPVAIKAIVVIMTQIVTGAYIYAHIPRTESPTIPEYLGMGFAIGSAISTLCDIFLKSTPFRSVAWLLPTFVIAIVVTAKGLKGDGGIATNNRETQLESTNLLAIFVISFLYLAHEFVWYITLFASGLCVLVAVNLRNRFKTRSLYLRSVIGLAALATASILAGIRFRSPFWWINSDDYQYFESLQIALARYGPRDQLHASGISITDYHFLSYAWTGLVDRVSAAPTWVILNRVTPVVVSIVLSSLVWSFISREGVQRPKLRFLLACLFPLLFVLNFGSLSSAVGAIYLFAAVFYFTNHQTAIIHWSRIPLGVLFLVFVIGTKVSNAPTVVVGLGVLALIGIATKQPWKWVSLTDLLVAMVTGVLYYFILLQHSVHRAHIDVELFDFAKGMFGDLNELSGLSLLFIGGIATSVTLATPFLGVVVFLLFSPSRWSMLGHFSLAILSLMTLYMIFLGGYYPTSSYFVGSALSILLLIALLAVSSSLRANKLSNQDFLQLGVFAIAGVASGFASIYLPDNFVSGGRVHMFGRAVASSHWIPLVVMGGLWLIYKASRHKKLPRIAIVLSLILAGGISASATVTAYDFFSSARQPNMSASAAESFIGTPDEIAAGGWIKSEVPVDAIIASNHFCGPEKCFGSDWFNEQVDFFRNNPKLLKYNTGNGFIKFGGSNMVLPAYSERRFLIQGPKFLWGLNNPPPWAIDRMNATLRFANSPSERSLIALRKFGVQYFVVDLESTAQRTWTPYGKLLYQNPSFAILQLIDEQ